MSRAAFDLNVEHIARLAVEARECSDLARLRAIQSIADKARADADLATDIVFKDDGVPAGRACVLILKTDVRLRLMLIRARVRVAELEAQLLASSA